MLAFLPAGLVFAVCPQTGQGGEQDGANICVLNGDHTNPATIHFPAQNSVATQLQHQNFTNNQTYYNLTYYESCATSRLSDYTAPPGVSPRGQSTLLTGRVSYSGYPFVERASCVFPNVQIINDAVEAGMCDFGSCVNVGKAFPLTEAQMYSDYEPVGYSGGAVPVLGCVTETIGKACHEWKPNPAQPGEFHIVDGTCINDGGVLKCTTQINLCNGVTYNPATQGCCGDPASPTAIIYDKYDAVTNPTGGSCCTSLGEANPTGSNPTIFHKNKAETCCPIDIGTAPNVCNGCQTCTTENSYYPMIFAPSKNSTGMTDWYCNTAVNASVWQGMVTAASPKGQCTYNCEGCTQCKDISSTPASRWPDLPGGGGAKQVDGKFCEPTAATLTDADYAKFDAAGTTVYDPPTTSANVEHVAGADVSGVTYNCFCSGDDKKWVYPFSPASSLTPGGGVYRHKCFYRPADLILQQGPVNTESCPYPYGQEYTEIANCRCSGASFCNTGAKDSQGRLYHQCATGAAASTCPAGYGDGDPTNFFGNPWTYDCGSNFCCDLLTPTTSKCGGPFNMFCVSWGTGASCTSIQDCYTAPPPPPNPPCTPNIVCGAWSACVNNQQTRTCNDLAGCSGSTTQTQPCVSPCVPSWTCGAWSPCINNQQTKTCTDSAGCFPPTTTTQPCGPTCTSDWSCDPWTECVNGWQTQHCEDLAGCYPPTDEAQPCTTTCTPNWACDPWSECIGNQQTRQCVDLVDCYPPKTETQECTTTCTPNWVCGAWGPCIGNQQTRECVDIVDCYPPRNETQNCTINQPPYAYNLNVDPGPYCAYSVTGIPAAGLAIFKWTYGDAENDHQTLYQFQISSGSDTDFEAGIVFDSGFIGATAVNGQTEQIMLPVLLSSTNPTSSCAPNCDYINYGVNYYWRVKVWEATTGYDSGWVNYVDTHTLPPLNNYIATGYPTNADDKDQNASSYTYPFAHPSPMIFFTPPETIAPSVPATFVEGSTCYNSNGSSYLCRTSGSTSYTWWFGDGDTSNTKGNVTHTYIQPKVYATKLQVCDDIGCCYATGSARVGSSKANTVPQWWEISPY